MVNNAQPLNIKRTAISDGDLGSLINLAGLRPDNTSPLARLQNGSSDIRKLQESGLVDAAVRPALDCVEALKVLANPDVELDLLWGGPNNVSLSKVYFSIRSGKLVSFTKANGSNNLSYFLSFKDITDLIAEKTAFPPVKEAGDISLEATISALPAFLSVLDLYREAQLKAALERRQEVALTAIPAEVNRVWQDAKTEPNFSWYAPAGYIAMANNLPASNMKIEEGLNVLKRSLILNQDGTLNNQGSAFASLAFPLMAFFGIKAASRTGSSVDKVHMAFFRGYATLLFAQVTTVGGQDKINIKSINTSQLPEILFNLVTRPFDVKPQPEPAVQPQPAGSSVSIACSKCGTINSGGTKFCSKCGASLIVATVTAKFCPKCGDPVKIGEKFCDKCGNKLV